MTVTDRTPSEDEQQRLDECVREPIRTPGAIQSHGALVAFDGATLEIVHSSESCASVLGIEATALLGQSAQDAFGDELFANILHVLENADTASNPVSAIVGGRRFDVIVHRLDELIVMEFEPSIVAADYQSAPAMYGAIHRLTKATTIPELWTAAAEELSRLTRFDRVMVYHFHADGHGEIVAEKAAEGMEPYLGLHYPASDIPAQARELYLTKLSRMIVNSSDESSALVSGSELPSTAGAQLDLSQAELRSVSPYHQQFMRNMGQASTLSLSLIHDGQLIGMITLAHRTIHRVPYILRQGLEILANQVSLQLSSMLEIRRLTSQMQVRAIRARLVAQLTASNDISDALVRGPLTLLDLIPAQGASMRLDGRTAAVGTTPSKHQTGALIARLLEDTGSLTLVSDGLALEFPQYAELVPSVAGIIVVPLGGEQDYIAWFRPEIAQTVEWLGDLTLANRVTPLSPRTSFSAWSQSVTGMALPWGGQDAEATELSRDLDSAMLARAESKLASLALHDALTALPNRRLLMDRVEHALAKYARGEELALLFIDLDRFKSVNDTSGHDVGDALLVHTAKQILATTRTQDTVARLGGDEFVVLCENTTREEADMVAARIVDAIRQPAFAGGTTVNITASVGIAGANFSFTATDLLREADAAMYRAKARGRDQASR